jgi:glycosyltransferase involved in cell wall biosynthesis
LKKKILFVSPFFGKNGAETVLFNLMSHINRDRFDIALATRHNAPLLSMLDKSIPVFTFNPETLTNMKTVNNLLNTMYSKFGSYVWYLNTISQLHLIQSARFLKIPFILHIHEMEVFLNLLDKSDVKSIINYPRLIITCSKSTSEVYRILGREKDMEVCYSNVDLKKIKTDKKRISQIRMELGVQPKDFLWVMSGRDDLNKDPVMFVDFAHELLKRNSDVHFCWIGGIYVSGYSIFAKAKAEYLGVDNRISWLGFLDQDYFDYVNAANGFVLTSYSDSFPLVAIEAQALGKPVVAFDSGGVKELVNHDTGRIVPNRTPQSLAEAAAEVIETRRKFSERKIRKNARQYDVTKQVRKWEKVLLNYL